MVQGRRRSGRPQVLEHRPLVGPWTAASRRLELEVQVELLGIVLISGFVLAVLVALLDLFELVDLVEGIVRAAVWLIRLVARVVRQLALGVARLLLPPSRQRPGS